MKTPLQKWHPWLTLYSAIIQLSASLNTHRPQSQALIRQFRECYIILWYWFQVLQNWSNTVILISLRVNYFAVLSSYWIKHYKCSHNISLRLVSSTRYIHLVFILCSSYKFGNHHSDFKLILVAIKWALSIFLFFISQQMSLF